MELTDIQRVDYRHAHRRIVAGWVVALIGCILFFIASIADFITFGLAVNSEAIRSDMNSLIEMIRVLVVAVVLIFAGIGGLCFLFDRSRMKPIGTLAAVIVLVVFVIDTVLAIRSLIHDLAGRSINPMTGENYTASEAWLNFILNLLDLQLSGGIYLIGWAIIKDYVGDDYDQAKK